MAVIPEGGSHRPRLGALGRRAWRWVFGSLRLKGNCPGHAGASREDVQTTGGIATMGFPQGLMLSGGASDEDIRRLVEYAGCDLPGEYLELLRWSNGIEGDMGPQFWLQLWSTDEVAELNETYRETNCAEGALMIGSDGGDTAFTIDTRPGRPEQMDYVQFAFPLMSWGDEEFRTNSLAEFVRHLRADPDVTGAS